MTGNAPMSPTSLPAAVTSPAGPVPAFSVLRWTLSFWLFSYVLLSAIASLIPTAPGVFNDTRFIATGVGALCFAAVLRWTRKAEHRLGASQVAAILATILPASLFVFAARVMMDLLQFGEIRDLNRDLRWAMIWAGYFGLWVSAALAIQWERCRAAQLKSIAAVPAAAATPVLIETWETALDAIADELGPLPETSRHDLAQRLSARAGYELADDWTGGVHNRRAEILRRVVARISADRLS